MARLNAEFPLSYRQYIAHDPQQAQIEAIDSLLLLTQETGRCTPLQPALQARQVLFLQRQASLHIALHALRQFGDGLQQDRGVRADQLGGRGWCWRPSVGNEVGDGEVDFVPDCADDRYVRCGDRACQSFVVECREILDRSPATGQQQNIAVTPLQRDIERIDQLFGRPLALYLGREYGDRNLRCPAAQHLKDVAYRSPRGRGYDSEASREGRQGLLTPGIEQPFGLKTFLQRLEFTLRGTGAGRLQVFDDELKVAARLVETDACPCQYLLAITGLEAQQLSFCPEQGAAHLGMGIFEAEIKVT